MKKTRDPLLNRLNGLELKRLGPEREAGLCIASIPVPRRASPGISLGRRPGTVVPLGQWHDVDTPSPRRMLVVADGGAQAPDSLRVSGPGTKPATRPPAASLSLIAQSDNPLFMWERHALRLEWKGQAIEIAMGLRTRGEIHWWEACRLVTESELPGCRTVEMGGAIPVVHNDFTDLHATPGYRHPFLHRHNWLNGRLVVRLHANGVCEVFAHHINSRFFDDGLPFDDVVPVIGFRAAPGRSGAPRDLPAWDGSCSGLTVGATRLDLTDVARLASPERPGNVADEGGFTVLQPYAGAELFGGFCPEELTGDPWIVHADQKRWLRGLARTLRFSLSLNPKRSPAVVRYLAPAWWYGACEEFLPAPLLPVSNAFDEALNMSRDWFNHYMVRGGFEDGAMPRHKAKPEWKGRQEPGWEGEVPYAHFLLAWRTGDAELYDGAFRDAYFVTDVCVDHAMRTIRMHGYPPNALAIPMARIHGTLAAWLECGDPYLLDTARSIVETTYWVHKNSWPRMAVGRDACFIRGAVLLYRYLGETGYLRIARDSIRDVIASQREEGSFGDQGGGTGIHQWGAYISKPWMGLMALGGVLDYLELFPDDTPAADCVKRFADWLMRERFEAKGFTGWGYQHAYNGLRQHINARTGKPYDLPGGGHWHKDYLARLMLFCARRYGRHDYLAAWEESYLGTLKDRKMEGCTDHFVAQAVQYIPWLQAKLWNARLTARVVEIEPVFPGDTSGEGRIHTPEGLLTVRMNKAGACAVEGAGKVRVRPLHRLKKARG